MLLICTSDIFIVNAASLGVVIGIVTMISLATFAAGSIPPLPLAYNESTITVKEACNSPAIDLGLVVKDQAGSIVKQTTVGTPVLIEGSVDMDCLQCQDDSRVILFEVRDKEGVTTFLAWQMFSAEDFDDRLAAGASWMPEKTGNYEIRFFTIACLNYSGVLPHVVTYEITVV
jgi:hypothetical protein